jgi:hypothetical protein
VTKFYLLVPPYLLFLLSLGFLGLAQPVWSIVDCARAEVQPATKKGAWAAALLLGWTFVSVFYGLVCARSGNLKKATAASLAIAVLSGGLCAGIILTDPVLKEAFLQTYRESAALLGR